MEMEDMKMEDGRLIVLWIEADLLSLNNSRLFAS